MNEHSYSVIVPAYHSARTIQECLDSIAAQTHPPSQILVVDDASKDNTIDQIKAWQTHNPDAPLTLMEQKQNGGPAKTRNAGIAAATAPWIAFLDADDAWLPWRIETQFDILEKSPEIIFLSGQTVDLQTTSPDGKNVQRPTDIPTRAITLQQLLTHNPIATSTVLVRKETLEQCGGFDTTFRGPEDYDLWLRLVACGKACKMEVPLSRYRTTVGSLSMDDRTFLPEVLRVLDKAFTPGGSLAAYRRNRRQAYAEQCTAASWMAYNRGDRTRALALLLRSWLHSIKPIQKEQDDPLQRIKLLIRYLRTRQ